MLAKPVFNLLNVNNRNTKTGCEICLGRKSSKNNILTSITDHESKVGYRKLHRENVRKLINLFKNSATKLENSNRDLQKYLKDKKILRYLFS